MADPVAFQVTPPPIARRVQGVPPDTPLTPAEDALRRRAARLLADTLNLPAFSTDVRGRAFSQTARVLPGGVFDEPPLDAETVMNVIRFDARVAAEGESPPRVLAFPVVLRVMDDEVFGLTDVGDSEMALSVKFFDACVRTNDPVRLAAVMMHEWMHMVGFVHEQAQDFEDVPYGVETIVHARARELLAEPMIRFKTAVFGLPESDPAPAPRVRWACPVRGGRR